MSVTKVFISYSREDVDALADFASSQTILERDGFISLWTDKQIQGGERWRKEIEKALKEANVAILFISEKFLASEFVWKYELPPLLAACEVDRLMVLPVFLSPSSVDQTGIRFIHPETDKETIIKLTEFQGFGTPAETLMEMKPVRRQRIFVNLANRIREFAKQTKSEFMLDESAHPSTKNEKKGSASTEQVTKPPTPNQIHRTDRESRFQKLEKLIAEALTTSSKTMELLETALLVPTGEGKPGSFERALWLTKKVMALQFEIGQSMLLDVYNKLDDVDDTAGIDAIKKTSRLLIPWLYVASQKVDIESWDQGLLGAVRTIPAGLSSFAEIVLAGLDHRGVVWKEISDPHCFPSGFYSVDVNQPEGGPLESVEQDLRMSLYKTVKPPQEAVGKSDDQLDDSIARRIKWLFTQGFRVYLIYWIPKNAARYQEQVERIQIRYPFLAVVMLNLELMGEHQSLFDDIRHLML